MASGFAATAESDHLIGVVDVGSNSVRLVVFTGPDRSPTPIFNEKVLPALGRGMNERGKLDPEGVEAAIEAIRRYVALAHRMQVTTLDIVGTAAIREADDGQAFVDRVNREFNVSMRILSGVDEARISALGVISGIPEARGVVGDLGGGSLELVTVESGSVGPQATLPLGPLRLAGLSHDEIKVLADRLLAGLSWLDEAKGRDLYLVGGAWRAIARIHMAQSGYPLHIIHQYRVPADELSEMTRVLARQSKDSIVRLTGVPKRRLETVPPAALVLRRLIKRVRPASIVFSANGLREGLHFDILRPEVRLEDPLIALCRDMGVRESRLGLSGDDLHRFLAPLFAGETPEDERLRLSASLLADVAWRVNPDYRGEQAFRRILRAPFVGIDHPSRAFVALAVHARYEGHIEGPAVEMSLPLLEQASRQRALQVGLAIRFAEALTGGTGRLETLGEIGIDGGNLVFQVTQAGRPMLGEVVSRRLQDLAACFSLTPLVIDAARRGQTDRAPRLRA